jgi:hypothetical protein
MAGAGFAGSRIVRLRLRGRDYATALWNPPIATLAPRQLSQDFGVKRIDGIIAINLLFRVRRADG